MAKKPTGNALVGNVFAGDVLRVVAFVVMRCVPGVKKIAAIAWHMYVPNISKYVPGTCYAPPVLDKHIVLWYNVS